MRVKIAKLDTSEKKNLYICIKKFRMNLQYITDNKGIETGVYIPIQDWISFVQKYSKIIDEINFTVPDWHKENVRKRLQKIKNEPERLLNWDEAQNKIIVE